MHVGPTSAAIVVSSSKGAILPTTMASLFVDNGYRTANNGTAWSAFSFVADYFDFNEYHSTSSFETAINYLKTDKDNDGNADYYIIASCGSGLFTSGGHYIVLVADNNGTITVYDPYLYNGKFTTASRRTAGVVVSGNSAYVSESSFKTYANYRNFWVFSNDEGSGNLSNNSTSSNSTTSVKYTRYVATGSSNLNVRTGPGTSNSITTSLKKGTAVTVVEVSGAWSRITSPANGWVSTAYLSATSVTSTTNSYTAKVTAKSGLNIRSKAGTNYSKVGLYSYRTVVTIKETSGNWGRTDKGWICLSYTSKVTSTSSSSVSYSTTVGKYYTLKIRTNLYSKGTLSGTTYNYLAGTKIKVISHYSNSVDYIYVPKTGRYAYCKINSYK